MTTADTTDNTLVRAAREGAVLHLRLNRPAKRNAVNDGLMLALDRAFTDLPGDVRCILLSGEGEHFCAGLDLSELSERTVYEGVLHSRMWHATLDKLQFAPVPVVAGILLSYALRPLVTALEHWRVPRLAASMAVIRVSSRDPVGHAEGLAIGGLKPSSRPPTSSCSASRPRTTSGATHSWTSWMGRTSPAA